MLLSIGGQLPEGTDGIMDALVGAIEANMDDARLVFNAISTLTQLSRKPCNVQALHERDGLSMVIDTMRAYTSDRDVSDLLLDVVPAY